MPLSVCLAWLGCIFNFSKRRLEATSCTSFSHLMVPGFFVFCALPPEGALRCVNRMLMANYAGAPHPLCAAVPRNHPFSRPSALDYSECETLGAAMINSAGELPCLRAQIEANYARGVGRRRRPVKKIPSAPHQLRIGLISLIVQGKIRHIFQARK